MFPLHTNQLVVHCVVAGLSPGLALTPEKGQGEVGQGHEERDVLVKTAHAVTVDAVIMFAGVTPGKLLTFDKLLKLVLELSSFKILLENSVFCTGLHPASHL